MGGREKSDLVGTQGSDILKMVKAEAVIEFDQGRLKNRSLQDLLMLKVFFVGRSWKQTAQGFIDRWRWKSWQEGDILGVNTCMIVTCSEESINSYSL